MTTVIAVRGFVSWVGGKRYYVQNGQRLTLPLGADWLTAGLVVPEFPTSTTTADDFSVDAFGRQRISATGQRFDVEFSLDLSPDLVEQITAGSGSVTYNSTHRVGVLSVVDAVAGSTAALVQQWHNPYTPGNSQLIEITGTLDASASAQLVAICATVKSEGGRDLGDIPGITRAVDTGGTLITVSSTLIPLLTIRPKLTLNSVPNYSLVFPRLFGAYAISNDAIIRVYKNATLTNPSWVSVGDNSVVEYDVSATAISGGEVVATAVLPTSAQSPSVSYPTVRAPLSLSYDGLSSDTMTIASVRLGLGDASVWAGAGWGEIK